MAPVRRIRDAVGRKMEIMIEGHGKWSLPTATRIARELKEYKPYWLEDLTRAIDIDSLVQLKQATSAPMLVSETLLTRYQYRPILDAGAADIVMVDPAWCGGISEARKIATMAEAYNLPVTFHDCVGPINLFAGLHLAINASNALYQESVRAFIRVNYPDLVTNSVAILGGRTLAPEGPGLGTGLLPDLESHSDAFVQESSLGK